MSHSLAVSRNNSNQFWGQVSFNHTVVTMSELEQQPTLISVNLFSDPNKPSLKISGIEKIDTNKQIQYLDPDQFNTPKNRKYV